MTNYNFTVNSIKVVRERWGKEQQLYVSNQRKWCSDKSWEMNCILFTLCFILVTISKGWKFSYWKLWKSLSSDLCFLVKLKTTFLFGRISRKWKFFFTFSLKILVQKISRTTFDLLQGGNLWKKTRNLKKTRFRPRKRQSKKEKTTTVKKKRKKTRSRPRKRPRKKEKKNFLFFLLSCFLL